MNTLFFKYAIEIERTGSITQAAENLYMAQPNLSKSIKELEDSLGFKIFERTSKGVIPTAKGNMFLDYARDIVLQLDKIDTIAGSDDESIQKFSISIPRGSYIAKGITSFVSELDDSKGIDLNILETNSMQAINNIAEGKFNLGIIRYQVTYERYFKDFLAEKQLKSDTIWEFEYLALMSASHQLADAAAVTREDLINCTEIIHGDNMIPYLSSERVTDKQSSPLKKKIYLYERCNQFDLLCHIPTTFMWVSPIPEDTLKRYELVQRKCPFQGNRFKDLLIYSDGYRLSELDKKFIDKLYKAKNEVSFKEYH
jgi:DNA-binding transcriptional LysR family regulator